jgi:ribonuclease HI
MESDGRLSGLHILIHTDGACSGNLGKGAWAAQLRRMDGEQELKKAKSLSGCDIATTKYRMELTAVIKAIEFLRPDEPQPVHVVSDSLYVVQGVTEYLAMWKANGWRTNSKKVVKNVDLWRLLDALISGRDVSWEWVRGHNGDPRNEAVDRLASDALRRPFLLDS